MVDSLVAVMVEMKDEMLAAEMVVTTAVALVADWVASSAASTVEHWAVLSDVIGVVTMVAWSVASMAAHWVDVMVAHSAALKDGILAAEMVLTTAVASVAG